MRYTVKKVRSFKGMDDYGYNADLYRNGKKVAEVINEGNGGGPVFFWMDRAEPEVDIHVHAHDGRECTYQGTPEQKLLEEFADAQTWSDTRHNLSGRKNGRMVVDDLVFEYENNKRFAKLCKTRTLFRLRDDPEEEWRTVNAIFTPEVKAWIANKYGSKNIEEIWNERLASR